MNPAVAPSTAAITADCRGTPELMPAATSANTQQDSEMQQSQGQFEGGFCQQVQNFGSCQLQNAKNAPATYPNGQLAAVHAAHVLQSDMLKPLPASRQDKFKRVVDVM